MKKITVAILSIILVAMGAMFIFAQNGGNAEGKQGFGKRGGHKRGGHGLFLRGLDLTDEQKAQVKTVTEASREKTKSLHEQLKASREQLDQATANGAFDEAQVTALAQAQAALHAQMIVEKERVKSQIFALLTDEQKAKASEMREKMKERFKNRLNKRQAEKTEQGEE